MLAKQGLKILQSGPMSLIQGQARRGMQHLGFSEGGPCDAYSHYWANYLLGNEAMATALEITMGPFSAEFQQSTNIALCGAKFVATLNGQLIDTWATHTVQPGDVLSLRPNNDGLRLYLAVNGGFQVTAAMGFNTELPKEVFFERLVRNEAVLPYLSAQKAGWINKAVPSNYIPDYKAKLTLRVFPSYQYQFFAEQERKRLCSNDYQVSAMSDRMGYRLQGEVIDWRGGELLSEGIALGSVQIPADGQPIVLLNDRQSIGGYPKLGCVIKEDCNQLAQRQAGQKVRFEFL